MAAKFKQRLLKNVYFQKISILPPRKGLEILGGWRGFPKTLIFKEMYEVELEFPEGWGALIKNPFCGGGMDILWNYTKQVMKRSAGKISFFQILSVDNLCTTILPVHCHIGSSALVTTSGWLHTYALRFSVDVTWT